MPDQSPSIKLMVFDPTWGLPSSSPFCIKLHAWMTMAGLSFDSVAVPGAGRGPKKKAPWIEDDAGPRGDSTLVISYLTQKHAVTMDEGMTAEEQSRAQAYRTMLEEHFYQVMMYTHFASDRGWEGMKACLHAAPAPARPVIAFVMRREVRKDLQYRGMGRHTHDEIIEFGRQDLRALSQLLGEQEFFFGRPRSFDACAYGFLSMVLLADVESELREFADAELPNLRAFCERFRSRYYGDPPAQGFSRAA